MPGIVIAIAAFIGVQGAHALSPDTYAANSVLSQGRWVKVSVSADGLYGITRATLRNWGFSNPEAVRIYGYGGERQADNLANSTFIDDLPLVQTVVTDAGTVVFFGRGPETWTSPMADRYVAQRNLYTNVGYYFITENADVPLREFGDTGRPEADEPATTFIEHIQHEQDIATPGEAGGILVGEDFRLTPQRSFQFTLPGRVADGVLWMECAFAAKTANQPSKLIFTANGTEVPYINSDRINSTSTSSSHYLGTSTTTRHTLEGVTGQNLTIGIRHSSPVTVNGAWLDYLTINYTRNLDLTNGNGNLLFHSSNSRMRLAGTDATTRVWDITDPANILTVNTGADGASQLVWTNSYNGRRRYAAFNGGTRLPEPKFEENVANQDLHSHAPVNMVIFTLPQWSAASERIAAIHKAEGLSVRVVNAANAYNEFSSGSPDVAGLRGYLKMLYDRGADTADSLRYVLLMGRATIDNRHNTPAMATAAPTLPVWVGGTLTHSLNDEVGYSTDDFLAMLDDNTGASKSGDNIAVAVGRIPVTSAAQANTYVDKLEQYTRKSKNTSWRNNYMVVADDKDNNVHVSQSEIMVGQIEAQPGANILVNKVYLDAYTFQNGEFAAARADQFRLLDEGVFWWTYIGHANNHSWTDEGQLTFNDINTMYLRNVPFLYAATCDFLRWDSATQSGGEILFHERNGGIIACISATRPVFIYDNGLFSYAMGRQLGGRSADGNRGTIGDIYRRAKNDIRSYDSNTGSFGAPRANENRLRYVLMGDPAMRLVTPDNIVTLDDVDGVPAVEGPDAPVVAARQTAVFNGSVTDPAGNLLDDFNGTLMATVFDAEHSTTTNGRGSESGVGAKFTFDQIGGKLYAGATKIVNGRFALKVTIPAEIADNFRPAAINMYAVPSDSLGSRHKQAIGLSRNFYISGYDEVTAPDSVAPVIETFYVNHPTFTDGALVNTSPMVIATVRDDRALNLSTSGYGHNMRLQLDGKQTYNDVSLHYTPATDGSASGTINYPLENLREGPHTLTLRISDSDGNLTSSTINFSCSADVAPKIYEVYSDANPATTQANFYLRHDRPDQMVNVTIGIYNLLGAPVWTKTVSGVSDMFLSSPVTWDLCDAAGHRVPRGIYLYRATITTGGEAYDTVTHRIAVAN